MLIRSRQYNFPERNLVGGGGQYEGYFARITCFGVAKRNSILGRYSKGDPIGILEVEGSKEKVKIGMGSRFLPISLRIGGEKLQLFMRVVSIDCSREFSIPAGIRVCKDALRPYIYDNSRDDYFLDYPKHD